MAYPGERHDLPKDRASMGKLGDHDVPPRDRWVGKPTIGLGVAHYGAFNRKKMRGSLASFLEEGIPIKNLVGEVHQPRDPKNVCYPVAATGYSFSRLHHVDFGPESHDYDIAGVRPRTVGYSPGHRRSLSPTSEAQAAYLSLPSGGGLSRGLSGGLHVSGADTAAGATTIVTSPSHARSVGGTSKTASRRTPTNWQPLDTRFDTQLTRNAFAEMHQGRLRQRENEKRESVRQQKLGLERSKSTEELKDAVSRFEVQLKAFKHGGDKKGDVDSDDED